MKQSRFTEEQIIAVLLREHEAGAKAAELCRKYGMSEATLDNWNAKFGGMDVLDVKRLRALEDENGKLKKLPAESMLQLAGVIFSHTSRDSCAIHAVKKNVLLLLGQRVVRLAVRRAKNNPRPQRVALLRLVGTNDPLQIRCASFHSHTIAKSKYAPCSRRFGEKWTTHSIARANPKPRLQGAAKGVREIGRGWESIS